MVPSKPEIKRKKGKTDFDDLPQPPSFSGPPELPPPPTQPDIAPPPIQPSISPPSTQTQGILARPPFPEPPAEPSLPGQDSFIIQDNITSDILNELRRLDFSSSLQHTPEKKHPDLSLKELENPRFLAAKEDYLAAGHKHLEMNFFDNAAMNYACAILSMLLGRDVYAASQLIAELGTDLPSPIINSTFFQGARLLLKGILLRNSSYLVQAEEWLLKDTNRLYKEDIELIHRALKQSEKIIIGS